MGPAVAIYLDPSLIGLVTYFLFISVLIALNVKKKLSKKKESNVIYINRFNK